MKGIGGLPYIDCQEHLDIQTLKDLNMEICMGIAVSDIKAGVYGPGVVDSERYGNFMLMKSRLSRDPASDEYGWNRMTHNQKNIFAKLYFHLYNPSSVVYLREPIGGGDPILSYRKKAQADGWDWTSNVKNFPKLKVWLDGLLGTVFQEYGRILFFIHEHDCKLLTHRDGVFSVPHRNEFLWINPTGIKKFFVYDETKDQRHDVNSPVAFFNDLDMHGGDTNECMTWTLRIDGVFTEEFRRRINIDHLTVY